METNDEYELHIYTRQWDDGVRECREELAASPDNEFVKLGLSTALFCNGQYAEAAELASQVAQDSAALPFARHTVTRHFAQRELYLATKRARYVYEEEARQIPGKDSFRMTMAAYEMVLRDFEEQLAIEHD